MKIDAGSETCLHNLLYSLGKLLNALTGLERLDKQYLAIDNLGALCAADIGSNEFVTDIFNKAGCAHLLNINLSPYLATRKASAETIVRYLKANIKALQ